MGLAEGKSRSKIRGDPQGSAWSRSHDGYGYKILSSQGWTPGSYLGAESAPHAEHFSAANASHIRVCVKDDNLGLGAKRGRANDENFGLDCLHSIYGRLNGKMQSQLSEERSRRDDVRRQLYVDRKFGGVGFVRGGFLVGDKVEDSAMDAQQGDKVENSAMDAQQGDTGSPDDAPEEKPSRYSRTRIVSETKRREPRPDTSAKVSEKGDTSMADRKSKKRLRHFIEEDSVNFQEQADESYPDYSQNKDLPEIAVASMNEAVHPAPTMQSRAERRQRKLERRARKDTKARNGQTESPLELAKSNRMTQSTAQDNPAGELVRSRGRSQVDSSEDRGEALFEHNASAVGRLAVRRRFIAQKKMSMADPQSLREILMVKP